MANEGYTVTPDGYTDDATGEFIQTGHQIEGTFNGEKTRLEEVEQQQERWVENPEDGSTEYDNRASAEDIDNLIDGFGGVQHYQDVSEWGTQHYSEDQIDYWNSLVSRGDLAELAEAMEFIQNEYEGRSEDLETFEDYSEDTDAETVEWVFNELIDRDYYEDLVNYAAENFDDKFIQQYNQVIETGNRQQIEKIIRSLNDYRTRQ